MPVSDELKAQVTLVGANEATAAINRLDAATGKVSATQSKMAGPANMAAAATGLITRESKNAGREMGMMVNVLAESAYSFGLVIPGARQLATQLAMAGGSAVTMGAALGPVGVAVGVLVGTMPALIGLLSDTEAATADAGAAADRAAKSFEDLVSAITTANRVRAQQSRVELGFGSVEEQQARLESMQGELEAKRIAARILLENASREVQGTEGRAQAMRNVRLMEAEVAQLQRDIPEARRQIDQARAEIDAINAEEAEAALELDTSGRGGGRGGRGRGGDRAAAILAEAFPTADERTRQANREALFELVENVDAVGLALDRAGGSAQDLNRFLQGLANDNNRRLEEMAEAEHRAGMASLARAEEANEERQRAAQEAMDREQAALESSISMSIDATGGMVAALRAGGKEALKSWATDFAWMQGLRALENVALAAANWANPIGLEEHLRAAAIFGVAAAIAGGGVGLASAASGGGGGKSSPASRPRDLGQGEQTQGSSQINVYLNAPHLVMTEAEGGRLIDHMLGAAQREGLVPGRRAA